MSESNIVQNLYSQKSLKYCVSCYKPICEPFSMCFNCNKNKGNLHRCDAIKRDKTQCKQVTINTLCYYHNKDERRLKKMIKEDLSDSDYTV